MHVTCTKRRGNLIVRYRSCNDPQCHGTGRGLEQLDNPPPKNLCRAIKRSRARKMIAAGILLLLSIAGCDAPSVSSSTHSQPSQPQPCKRVVVYDFSATWCGACRQFSSTFARWSKAHGDACTTFTSVDIDRDRETAQRFAIVIVPTIVVTIDGRRSSAG